MSKKMRADDRTIEAVHTHTHNIFYRTELMDSLEQQFNKINKSINAFIYDGKMDKLSNKLLENSS